MKVELEQKELEALRQVAVANHQELCKAKDANWEALDKQLGVVIKQVDDLRQQVQNEFTREQRKVKNMEARVLKCIEVGGEVLHEMNPEAGAPHNTSAVSLIKFAKFAKEAAQLKSTDTKCFKMQFTRGNQRTLQGSIGKLQRVKVGTVYRQQAAQPNQATTPVQGSVKKLEKVGPVPILQAHQLQNTNTARRSHGGGFDDGDYD